MAVARYYKTLFLPSMEGQYKLWTQSYKNMAAKVDEIVQLGNLVGLTDRMRDSATRGPNMALLNYTLLWRSTFPNWMQIVGPHEILALNYPDEWTNEEANRVLRRRWLDGYDAHKSFQVAGVNKNRLITHGGLTFGEWREIGCPTDAHEAARLLNEKYHGTLFQGQCFSLHGKPNFSANPIFADPLRELYPSWITADVEMPFHQIHGSAGLNSLEGRQHLDSTYSLLSYADSIRYYNFGSYVVVGDKVFVNVHSDFQKDTIISRLPEPWSPLIEKMPVVDVRDELFGEDRVPLDRLVEVADLKKP